MATYTLSLGGMSDDQHAAEELVLPVLPERGAISAAVFAFDCAAMSRRGVVIIAPKGMGKSVGLRMAFDWFSTRERAMKERDNSYRVRRILRLRALRNTPYRETAVLIAKNLSPAYSDRVQGRKKEQNEIRADVLHLCIKQGYALIVMDEGEMCSDDALTFLRDLMADAEETDGARYRANGTGAAGVGVVVVGDESLHQRLSAATEASHRWSRVMTIEPLDVDDVKGVLGAWFPAFSAHVESVGETAWTNYLASKLCRGQQITFRLLENIARSYFHYMFRTNVAFNDRETVPFQRHLFEKAADDAAWAYGKDTNGKPKKKRPRGNGPSGGSS